MREVLNLHPSDILGTIVCQNWYSCSHWCLSVLFSTIFVLLHARRDLLMTKDHESYWLKNIYLPDLREEQGHSES